MAKHIPHIFLTAEEITERQITGDNFHHLFRVLRLKQNYSFFALDNNGSRYNCIVTDIVKNSAVFDLISSETFSASETKLNLFVAMLKTDKFEEILDKATQLGVDRIIPFESEFSTVTKDFYQKKYSRFNTIIKTAAEQSQRVFLPVMDEIKSFNDILASRNVIVAYEKSEVPLKNILKNLKANEVNLVFGPEGGWSDNEIQQLREKGYPLVSLGKNILRAETAVITTVGIVKYELGLD